MRRARVSVVAVVATLIVGMLAAAGGALAVHRPAAAAPPVAAPAATHHGLITLASVPAAPEDRLVGLATFRGPAGARAAAAAGGPLHAAGVDALPFRNLPIAVVAGTKAQLGSIVGRGLALDVYPDERLRLYSASSTAAMGADRLRSLGVTGKGVGVAIVDTGVDATHPDLADHVLHNFKLVGPEHLDVLGGKAGPGGTLFVPVDALPYNNSDTTSGHGTHVAGIVAADAHTSPDQVGMAPDASLIAYGSGDALSIFTVLAAFDDILTHRTAWNIRVVNNSWGASGRMFDPAHPVNVATKALHDAGVVVVFAAGNDTEEGTLNPYAAAPWVIAAGSATEGRSRSGFTSGGYQYDNSEAALVPVDRHLHFDGDRLGIYHPDVSAPGTDVTSSGTPTGVGVLNPTLPGGTATLSGTSMAAPHLTGLAADLIQARPSLTPDQVRQVLEVTAVPMAGDAPFWHSGHGFANASAALDLVRRPDFGPALLDPMEAAADARALAARPFAVRAGDLWSFTPQLVSVGGSDRRTFSFTVAPGASAVKAVVTYPSLGLLGLNPFEWRVAVVDAGGRTLGTSTPSNIAGTSSVLVDLAAAGAVTYGEWKAVVTGELGVSDTDALIGNVVTLAVAQLQPRPAAGAAAAPAGPAFVPTGSQPFFFQKLTTPSGDLAAGNGAPVEVAVPEGCVVAAGAPQGVMGAASPSGGCAVGLAGWPVTHGADVPVEFATAPLGQPLVVGGPSTLTLWLADPAAAVWTAAFASRIAYQLDAVDAAGHATEVAAGDMDRRIKGPAEVGASPTRAEYPFTVSPTTVPAGSTLRLRLRFSGAYTATLQLFLGGPYADAGLRLGTGRIQ